jgi:hypothetical protein
MTLHAIATASVFALASASLAGCGGGAQLSPTNAFPSSSVSQATAMDGQSCDGSDGIKVLPCRLTFDSMHPGPKDAVVSSGDNDRQTIKERDDCVARNVATVTRMSNHRYAVTAGSAKGSCTANFVAARQNGMRNDDNGHRGASLTIRNAI